MQLISTLRNKNPVIEKLQSIDHLKDEEDHIAGGLYHVLLGLCGDFADEGNLDAREQAFRERQRAVAAACEFVELRATRENRGQYFWDFHFSLPKDSPVSYIDEFAETLCSITAVLDCPAVPKAISQMTHYINICSRCTNTEESRAPTASITTTTTTVPATERESDEVIINTNNHFSTEDGRVYGDIAVTGTKGRSILPFIRWFGICGAGNYKNQHNLHLSTSLCDGFCFTASQPNEVINQAPLLVPVSCSFQLHNKSNGSLQRYQLKTKIVKDCRYSNGKRRGTYKTRHKFGLWTNIMDLDKNATEVEFLVPIQIDLSQLRTNLNAWPRPMVGDENASSGGSSENSPSSISSRGSSTEMSENNRCIDSCTMDTGIYSVKYYLEVELYKVSKSKCISTISQEIKIMPTMVRKERQNILHTQNRVQLPHVIQEVQTPRRTLGNVTNTIANTKSARPPTHPNQNKHSTTQIDSSSLSSSSQQIKIVTPMAKLAVPRVEAEAISRGSAAIIMDRSREASAGLTNATPEQFVVMRRIANENDVVILNEAAEFSPALARLCTPSVSPMDNAHMTNVAVTPRVIFDSNDGDENEEPQSNSIMNQSRAIEI